MKKQQAMRMLFKYKITKKAIVELWKNLSSRDYFAKESVQNIVLHTKHILEHTESYPDKPLVIVRAQVAPGYYEVFVYMKDEARLLTRVATTFANLALSVLNANIVSTKNGYRLDSYVVYDLSRYKAHPERMNQIKQSLIACLNASEEQLLNPKMIRKRPVNVPTEVLFEIDEEQLRTCMQLRGTDRLGLLAQVGEVLSHEDSIVLKHAKITTRQHEIENWFYLTDHNEQPLKPEQIQPLKQKILAVLEEA